jgi:N-acetylmuramoyl-L-alanine amidase
VEILDVELYERLEESYCTRQIGALDAEYLQEKGHGVNLLRIDKSNSYNCEDCYQRANEANNIAKTTNVELYVEIHINAGGGTGPKYWLLEIRKLLINMQLKYVVH